MDAGSILKVEPTGFPGRSAVGARGGGREDDSGLGGNSGDGDAMPSAETEHQGGGVVMWSSVGCEDGGVCGIKWRCAQVCAGVPVGAQRLEDSQAVVRNVGGPGMEVALKGVEVGPWVLGGAPG